MKTITATFALLLVLLLASVAFAGNLKDGTWDVSAYRVYPGPKYNFFGQIVQSTVMDKTPFATASVVIKDDVGLGVKIFDNPDFKVSMYLPALFRAVTLSGDIIIGIRPINPGDPVW